MTTLSYRDNPILNVALLRLGDDELLEEMSPEA